MSEGRMKGEERADWLFEDGSEIDCERRRVSLVAKGDQTAVRTTSSFGYSVLLVGEL
jgi:hypothetical protein